MTAHRCFFPRRRRPHGPAALSELPELDSVETQLHRDFQQADVIDLTEITVYGPEGPTPFAAPHGVTVLSQTCDIVLPNRRTVQVAPLKRILPAVTGSGSPWQKPGLALCRPPADAGCEVLEAVKGAALGVDILTVDEYGYDRYRRSEALDLDHLSAPLPK